jgi:hypothetical protein
LERGEGHGALAVECQDLRVQHEAAGDRPERVEQLGIPPGDAVEGARVELDPVLGLVHLGADAVIFVLDDVRRRKTLRHFREVEHGRREHHPDRTEVRERRLAQRVVLRA